VLGEREQLGNEDILEVHHRHRYRRDREPLGGLDALRGHLHPLGFEDEIDEDLVVPCLEQPLLGRVLATHPGFDQSSLGAPRVLGQDHQIDVVLRPRSATRPDGDAATDHERHPGLP
jgi:hypothetical protein